MSVPGAGQTIASTLRDWPGIDAQPHRYGGMEYRLGRREIGHVHGDHLVDIPFPKDVRDAVVSDGRAEPHHILPRSGWVSIYLKTSSDVDRAIELLRYSFEIAASRAPVALHGDFKNLRR
ncbi:MAG TPA: luciferase family protein [Bryobacteraceae bacterium]|nr:luciferase family protein [Bryobacteraceae bacterium]